MTARTFQHRVTLPAVAVVLLVAAVAFFFFMSRDKVLAVMAVALVCLDVVILERIIHTSYTLTDNGLLLVDRGRFARRQTIHICDILQMEQRKTPLYGMHYILIEYGPRKFVSILTDNEQGFMAEISKRQKIDTYH